MEFSKYLKDFSNRNNLKQSEVAEILEAHQTNVHRWMSGKVKPFARTEYQMVEKLKKWEVENGVHVPKEQ